MTATETIPTAAPGATPTRTPRAMGTVHIVGAGPVGLFLAALLQSVEGQRIRLYERRDGVHAHPDGVARRRTSRRTRSTAIARTRSIARTWRPSSIRAELETGLAYRQDDRPGPAGAARGLDAWASSRSTPSSGR